MSGLGFDKKRSLLVSPSQVYQSVSGDWERKQVRAISHNLGLPIVFYSEDLFDFSKIYEKGKQKMDVIYNAARILQTFKAFDKLADSKHCINYYHDGQDRIQVCEILFPEKARSQLYHCEEEKKTTFWFFLTKGAREYFPKQCQLLARKLCPYSQ